MILPGVTANDEARLQQCDMASGPRAGQPQQAGFFICFVML